ncbi:MAG: hypothetical protein LBP93_09805, partial [Treponema sp.]|nr:hypothetical protein [Treponema sp.]
MITRGCPEDAPRKRPGLLAHGKIVKTLLFQVLPFIDISQMKKGLSRKFTLGSRLFSSGDNDENAFVFPGMCPVLTPVLCRL